MKLLATRRSPYARKVMVLALEKGIPLDFVDEDLKNKSSRLLQAHPLGKIPTLICHDGQAIYDSHVICVYLDYLKPWPRFIPDDKDFQRKLAVLRWEALADDLMNVAINAYMEKVRHPQDFNADFIKAQTATIKDAYAHIEENCHALNDFDLASVSIASAIGYIHFRLPHLKVTGKLAEWFDAISQRPSMAQTIPVS